MFSFQKFSFAQDTLPKVTVTQLGTKVLVSWNNPFISVANINIQRSGDSLKNFTTIGSVLNVDPGINGFMDTKEFIPSNQYYRVFISFQGGSYLFSPSHRPGEDTLSELPPIEQPVANANPNYNRNLFVPSRHIYTGKDNNVIISLPDAARRKYSIRFYRADGTFLFAVPKINQNYLTLEKSNFLRSGLFIFELYDNHIIIERHKFFIPKDGQPMPAMDAEGNEIR
ncbi:MAG: hypothetical protein ABI374_08850 [Ginsengibacter sp.]